MFCIYDVLKESITFPRCPPNLHQDPKATLFNINTNVEDDPNTDAHKDVAKDSGPTRKRDPMSVSSRDVPTGVLDRKTIGNILDEPDGVPGMSHPGTSRENRKLTDTENRLGLWHGTP